MVNDGGRNGQGKTTLTQTQNGNKQTKCTPRQPKTFTKQCKNMKKKNNCQNVEVGWTTLRAVSAVSRQRQQTMRAPVLSDGEGDPMPLSCGFAMYFSEIGPS